MPNTVHWKSAFFLPHGFGQPFYELLRLRFLVFQFQRTIRGYSWTTYELLHALSLTWASHTTEGWKLRGKVLKDTTSIIRQRMSTLWFSRVQPIPHRLLTIPAASRTCSDRKMDVLVLQSTSVLIDPQERRSRSLIQGFFRKHCMGTNGNWKGVFYMFRQYFTVFQLNFQ
jgi:hypothetical protein